MEQNKTETNEISQYLALFMKTKGRGIGYARAVDQIGQGHTIEGSVLINGRLTVDKLYATKKRHVELFLQPAGPFWNHRSRSNLLKDCKQISVLYLNRISTNCVWSKHVTVTDKNEAIRFRVAKSSFLIGFGCSKRNKSLAVEIDIISINFWNKFSICGFFRMSFSVSSY